MTRESKGTSSVRAIVPVLLAGVAACFWSTGVSAQEVSSPEAASQSSAREDGNGAEIVVFGAPPELFRASSASSITRFDLPIEETPQAVSVLTGDLIKTANIQSLEDASYFVPGLVELGVNGFGEPRSSFKARGVNLSITNSFKLDNYSFAFQGILDMVGIERIEVVRGPSAISYGQASYGGLINLVTKKPQSKPYYAVSATYGSYNSFGFDADATGPLTDDGRLRFRLGVGYRTADSFRDGEDSKILTVVPNLVYELSDRTELSILGYFQDAHSTLGGPVPILRDASGALHVPTSDVIPRSTFLGNSERNNSDNEIRSAVLKLRHDFDDTMQVDAVLTYSDSHLKVVTSYASPFSPTSSDPLSANYGLVPSYSQVLIDDNTYFNAELSLQKDFSAFGQEHKLFVLAGYQDYRRWVGYAGGCIPQVNIFDFKTSDFKDVFVTQDESENKNGNFCFGVGLYEKRTNSNIGAQAQINITDRLSLLLGARYDSLDRLRIDSDHGLTRDFIKRVGTVLLDDKVDEMSFRVGAVYEVTDSINAYATYVTGFTPQIGVTRGGNVVGNEVGKLYEVGAKGVFGDGALGVNAAFFILDTGSSSIRDPSNVAGELFVIAAGANRRKGLEIEAVGKITKALSISANYAYVTGKTTSAPQNPALEGQPLSVGPEHKGSVFVNYTFDEGSALKGLNVNAGVAYTGAQLPRNGISLGYKIPSYTTASIGANYALTDKLELGFRVSNLFDEEYVLPGADSYGVYYAEPRTFLVSLRAVM